MTDTQTAEQRRDDDFDSIMKGLAEAAAHAEGGPEGDGVRVYVPSTAGQRKRPKDVAV